MRCAWHPKYHGYPKIYRIGSWRGRRLEYSDGMCRSCSRRWIEEFRSGRLFAGPESPPLVPRWMPRVGVALALTAAVIFAARPVDHTLSQRATANNVTPAAVTSEDAPSALAGAPSRPPTDRGEPRSIVTPLSSRHERHISAMRRASVPCARDTSSRSPLAPGRDCAAVVSSVVSAKASPVIPTQAP